MLEPATHRRSFLDALRPPPGYRLSAGLGTTYNLDFEVLTAVLLAFLGEDLDAEAPDRVAVLESLLHVSRRFRVFANAGSVPAAQGHHLNRLFALYDAVVRQVRLGDASFHPKLWVLKFDPPRLPERRQARPVYRLVCASRNLSASRCWELGVVLEGERETGYQGRLGAEAAGFFRRVLRTRAGDVRAGSAVTALLEELPEVRFETSREMDELLELRWQWPGDRKPLRDSLPTRGRRALLVSPFLRAGFVSLLRKRFDRLVIVSTQQELDALAPGARNSLDEKDLFVLTTPQEDEVPTSHGLHAKLLVCDSNEGRRTFLGSANGSVAGWGLGPNVNCEAMLEMRPGLSFDAIFRALVFDDDRDAFHPWIQPYQPEETAPDEQEQVNQRVDEALRQAAQLEIEGRYDPRAGTLILRCPNTDRLPVEGELRLEISPYLLSEREDGFQPLHALARQELVYVDVGRESLCEFLLLRISVPAFEVARTYVLQLQGLFGIGDRELRDQALAKGLLDASDSRALLFRLLGLRSRSGGGHRRGPPGRHDGSGPSASGLLEDLTLERVLQACAAEPDRVGAIDSTLDLLRGHGAVDGDFLRFWDNLKGALDQVAKEGVGV
jgi:hypothetical protein